MSSRNRIRSRTDTYTRWYRRQQQLVNNSGSSVVSMLNLRKGDHEKVFQFLGKMCDGRKEILRSSFSPERTFAYVEFSTKEIAQRAVSTINKMLPGIVALRTLSFAPYRCFRFYNSDQHNSSLVVKNIPYDCTEQAFASELLSIGVTCANVVFRKDTKGAFSGTAFVELKTVEEADWAGNQISAIMMDERLLGVEFKRVEKSAQAPSPQTSCEEGKCQSRKQQPHDQASSHYHQQRHLVVSRKQHKSVSPVRILISSNTSSTSNSNPSNSNSNTPSNSNPSNTSNRSNSNTSNSNTQAAAVLSNNVLQRAQAESRRAVKRQSQQRGVELALPNDRNCDTRPGTTPPFSPLEPTPEAFPLNPFINTATTSSNSDVVSRSNSRGTTSATQSPSPTPQSLPTSTSNSRPSSAKALSQCPSNTLLRSACQSSSSVASDRSSDSSGVHSAELAGRHRGSQSSGTSRRNSSTMMRAHRTGSNTLHNRRSGHSFSSNCSSRSQCNSRRGSLGAKGSETGVDNTEGDSDIAIATIASYVNGCISSYGACTQDNSASVSPVSRCSAKCCLSTGTVDGGIDTAADDVSEGNEICGDDDSSVDGLASRSQTPTRGAQQTQNGRGRGRQSQVGRGRTRGSSLVLTEGSK